MIIGLTGKKGSGKTTAAKLLDELVPGIVHINFKDAMIAEMKQTFPGLLALLAEHYSVTIDGLFANKPPMMRKFMQEYGTELRRVYDGNENYWADKLAVAIAELPAGTHVVIDDVRFLNEAATVRSLGGTLVRISRQDASVLDGSDVHQSETEMETIATDYTIFVENGDIAGLRGYLKQITMEVLR